MAGKRTIWDYFRSQSTEPPQTPAQPSRKSTPLGSFGHNNLSSLQPAARPPPVASVSSKTKVLLSSSLSLPPVSNDLTSALKPKKKASSSREIQKLRPAVTPAKAAATKSLRTKAPLGSKRPLSLSLLQDSVDSSSAHMARKKPKSIGDSTTGLPLQAATQPSAIKLPLSFDDLPTSISPMPPPPQATDQVSGGGSPLSSSPSLPPSSNDLPSSEDAPMQKVTPLSSSHLQAWDSSSALEIKDSDDESESSDKSLEDLANLLTSKGSEEKHRQQSFYQKTPKTPVRSSKHQKNTYSLPSSPLSVLPKYKFDLSSLLSHAEKDAAAEASSKRVQSMLAGHGEEESSLVTHSGIVNPANFTHGAILESVVAEAEDGTAHKVTRAIKRTEATVEESRWYFFETQSKAVEPERKQFPKNAVQQEWRRELEKSNTRHHTFTSGFAADMVMFGKSLPDEIFLWLLEEVCVETSELLRSSYLNVLNESTEQAKRLVTPEVIQKMFQSLGGSTSATTIDQEIRPVQKLVDPYPDRDWAQLLSTMKLFGHIGDQLNPSSRTQLTVLLLRLSVDQLILENVDLLVTMQQTLRRLCRATPNEDWETFCQEVCTLLFNGIELSSLRKQLVENMSSNIPRIHDLRRRLAMCFFFDDISYSKDHSHNLTNLDEFLIRLGSPAFQTSSKTNWIEVAALIDILDIAIDDGRCSKVDLSDRDMEYKFNADVDDICILIKRVMKMVGSDGAAFMSRLTAKDSLELVAQRINDLVRTKPKPREGWFDRPREKGEQTFEAETAGMDSFVSKMERIGKGKVSK